MIITLFGAPGSGKGTVSNLLQKRLDFKILSMGNVLREHVGRGTALGCEAKSFMEKGLFVPDHLVDGLVAEELKNLQEDAKVILDGYPRTKQQAEFLIDYLKSGSKGKSFAVLSLEIDKETLVGRLLNRKVCNNKSCQLVMCKDDSECKKCGGELIIRVDDNLEAIETRQSDFEATKNTVLNYYNSQSCPIESVDLNGLAVEEAYTAVVEKLTQLVTLTGHVL